MKAPADGSVMPGARPLVGHFPAYSRDPLGFATAARAHGGVVDVRFGPSPALMISDPTAIEEVLVTRHRDYVKGRANQRVAVVVGNGILLSEGETWRAHRRLVQPAFRHDRVAAWGGIMVEETERLLATWDESPVRDVHADLSAMTLAIVGRTLLDSRISGAEIDAVRSAAATLTDHFDSRFNTLLFFLPDGLPTPGNRRMRAAVRRLDRIIYRLLAERRAKRGAGDHAEDVISMLIESRDGDATALSDREVRDEVMTLFMAGHETTAVALTWALDLLARNPEAQARLHAEVAATIGTRSPTVADLPDLPYAEAVVNEVMRLCPPAYALSREAVTPTSVGGRPLPRSGIAFVSIFATHRRPAAFDDPDTFRPERWLDGLAKRLPRGAYIPFAEGPRKCVGAGFAMQEMILAVTTIIGRFVLRPVGEQAVRPRPAITLRPAGPVWLHVARRAEPATDAT